MSSGEFELRTSRKGAKAQRRQENPNEIVIFFATLRLCGKHLSF